MNIESIIPINEANKLDETINLVAELVAENQKIINLSSSSYALYADNKPDNSINLFLANELECKNNVYFSKFVEFMLKMTTSGGTINADIPNGLILKIKDPEGNPLIEALEVDTNKKTLTINHSFQIKE